eukprot:PhF_6_TR6071/c0_g1_i1/m.8813/K06126/COQ6; ubiquinone biosynthesis monooxygenase Coq6
MLQYDVCIIGSGIAGTTLARALQKLQRTQGLKVCLLDRIPLNRPVPVPAQGNELRTVSLTPASKRILTKIGIPVAEFGHTFDFMTIRDCDGNVTSMDAQGTIVGNNSVLSKLVASIPQETLMGESTIQKIELPTATSAADRVIVSGVRGNEAFQISAKLVVGCDGSQSMVRKVLDPQTVGIDYRQHGCVMSGTIQTPSSNQQLFKNTTCYQNFLADGSIIAFLPTSPTTANVVFSTFTPTMEKLKLLKTPQEVLEAINTHLNAAYPRDIPEFISVNTETPTSPMVASFPLALNAVPNPAGRRVILVGDASRSIHPLAGQGLNLGLYDVAALVDLIAIEMDSGNDIGLIGSQYTRRWSAHSWPMIGAMEFARTMFASDNFWVRGVRKHGMTFLDSAKPLQRAIQSFASGSHVGGVLFE